VYLVQVSLLLIGQQGLGHCVQVPTGWRVLQILRQRPTNSASTTLSAIQAASQSTFNNIQLLYTSLVISRNDNNKQLTLLSQRKLAVPRKVHFLQYKIIGAPKYVKNGPVLYLVDLKLTIHVIKSQIHLPFKTPFLEFFENQRAESL
jgi:hypothetical protein